MILVGDCIESMRGLPAESVQTCVTSPPYFGLRDYGHDGQIGLEPTPEAFVAKLVEVFREVRRVLRDDGTLWLNLGDSYSTESKWGGSTGGKAAAGLHGASGGGRAKARHGIPDKNLLGIPWRVAFALQADGAASPAHMRDIERIIAAVTDSYDTRAEWPDRIAAAVERLEREHIDANRGGWYLRQDIIWHKPNPMPESVRDRCTKAHEYLFLLSKGPRYHFDADAIKEPIAASSVARLSQDVASQRGSDRVPGKTNGTMKAVRSARDSFKREGSKREQAIPGQTVGTHRPDREESGYDLDTRNKRSVWTVPTMPFREAHFATFPEALIEPCILAGAPAGATVLDPFLGAGTTAVVCERLGRKWIGCELNPEYGAIAEERIRNTQPGLGLEHAA